MGTLDLTLALLITPLSLASLAFALFSFRKALSVAHTRDGDFKMFLWSVGSMIGWIIGGMTAAYILLPILFHSMQR
ncbi:MAG: hypothetical protein C4326_12520 [Ignavibacteria bacterium]